MLSESKKKEKGKFTRSKTRDVIRLFQYIKWETVRRSNEEDAVIVTCPIFTQTNIENGQLISVNIATHVFAKDQTPMFYQMIYPKI